MIETVAGWLSLSPNQALIMIVGVFVAAIVRGFSGFALSAVTMAIAVFILPPVLLIPVCLLLEVVAGVLMLRGGLREADIKLVLGLTAGQMLGIPLGLLATTSISTSTSTLIAQLLILVLATAQLMQWRPAWMTSKRATVVAGIIAGVAAGLANLAGMVVAVFIIAQQLPARRIRGSLVMFLFISSFLSAGFQTVFGVLTQEAITRGLVLGPVVVLGVLIGQWLFRPEMEVFYKRSCLGLLITLALVGLARMVFVA